MAIAATSACIPRWDLSGQLRRAGVHPTPAIAAFPFNVISESPPPKRFEPSESGP